jgi:hypothetical protein
LKKSRILVYNSKFKILLGVDARFQGLFIFAKYSGKNKYERYLLFSEKFIYKLTSFNISSLHWVIAINSIHSVKLSKDNPKQICLCVTSSVNKKIVNERKYPIKSKDEYKFELKYLTDIGEMIFQIRKNVFNNTKGFIKITN